MSKNGKYQEDSKKLVNSNGSLNSEDIKNLNKEGNFDEVQVNELKILTYNVFMRPPPVKNNEDDYKNERHKLIMDNEIEKYDIICFQELFRLFSLRRHKMVYSGIKKGLYYHASAPQPSFFTSYIVDGGLTIISKHPIVETYYKSYSYGILSDGITQKGVLYAKIKINDKYLHMFNTHTQASYQTNEKEIKQTVITRLDQILEMRQILEYCLHKYGFERGDICLFAGDFNVDSAHPNHPMHFLSESKKLKEYLGLSDTQETFDEYKAMIDIISGKGKDSIIDICRQAHNGKPQITFADTFVDKNGELQPLETALTDTRDLKTEQSLDYIMQIIPNGMMVDNMIKSENGSLNNKSKTSNINVKNESKGGFSLGSSSNTLINRSSKQIQNKQFSVDFSRSKVEKFFIQGQKFTQLSDHYAVSTVIKYQ